MGFIRKSVKWCKNCGKGSADKDRKACKDCGGVTWETKSEQDARLKAEKENASISAAAADQAPKTVEEVRPLAHSVFFIMMILTACVW